MTEPNTLQDVRDAARRQMEAYRQQDRVMDVFEFLPILNDDGGNFLGLGENGEPTNAWLHKNDAGDWDVVFLNQEQVSAVYETQAKDIIDQHRDAAQNLEFGAELSWFDNRNPNGNPREIPEIQSKWRLSDGDDFKTTFDINDFELVRVRGDNPGVVAPSNGLFPPGAFNPRNGELANSYRLQLKDPDNPPEGLPSEFIEADGMLDVSELRLFVRHYTEDPGEPGSLVRFKPDEEGFVVDRMRINGPEPEIANTAMAIGTHMVDRPNSEVIDLGNESLPVLAADNTPDVSSSPKISVAAPDYSRVNESLNPPTPPPASLDIIDAVQEAISESDVAPAIVPEVKAAAPVISSVRPQARPEIIAAAPDVAPATPVEVYAWRDADRSDRYIPVEPSEFLETLRMTSQGHREAGEGYFGIDQTLREIESIVNNARFAAQEGGSPAGELDTMMRYVADHPAHGDIVSSYALELLAGNSPDHGVYEQMMRDRYEGKSVDLPEIGMDDLKDSLQSTIESGQNPMFAVQALGYGATLVNNINSEFSPYALAENAKSDLQFVEQQLRDMPENAQKIVTHAMEANPHFADVIARFAMTHMDSNMSGLNIQTAMNQIDYKAQAIQARPEGIRYTFENAASPENGQTLDKAHYYDVAKAMVSDMVRQEGGIESVLADHALNGFKEFPYMPQTDSTGLVTTIKNGDTLQTVWHDRYGQEVLFTPEELGAHLSSLVNTAANPSDIVSYYAENPEVESAVQAIALALHAADAVEAGRIEPTIDRTPEPGPNQTLLILVKESVDISGVEDGEALKSLLSGEFGEPTDVDVLFAAEKAYESMVMNSANPEMADPAVISYFNILKAAIPELREQTGMNFPNSNIYRFDIPGDSVLPDFQANGETWELGDITLIRHEVVAGGVAPIDADNNAFVNRTSFMNDPEFAQGFNDAMRQRDENRAHITEERNNGNHSFMTSLEDMEAAATPELPTENSLPDTPIIEQQGQGLAAPMR